jgi:hypothetical protein
MKYVQLLSNQSELEPEEIEKNIDANAVQQLQETLQVL